MREQDEKTRIKIHKDFATALKDQGVPWSVFAEREFALEQACANISYEADRMKPVIYKKSEQLQDFLSVISEPFNKPYLYVISGKPADTQACAVAAVILIAASMAHSRLRAEQPSHRYARMNKPRWVKLSNDFKDNVHDANWKPAMMVLSNITPNSSALKLEKVRDLLEFYDNIPRVVVVNEYDPITFLNHKIHYKADHIMMLSHGAKKIEI
jgi:hypothetical protein